MTDKHPPQDGSSDHDRTIDSDATIGAGEAGSAPDGAPASIGPYRILRRLGEGGMGEVYLASQVEPIRRLVALKIIKPGMDTRQVVARFDLERQTLAMMNHPGIARVYDAGQTEQGRPYFVMEFVEGVPINRYCDARRLSTRQRLELMTEVCAGVQHAHQKAIIHRDLKPGNILVTEVDGKPVPKIIDFGIARATEQRDFERTMFTRVGHVVGTPAYMSPEQTEPNNPDIDTRTDIYSLGVVLYELLVGLTPFDTESVYSAGYDAMLKHVREQEAPRPSLRLRQSAAHSTSVAEKHATDPDRLVRSLRGDLDWILLKALEKDRSRRYETANALAMDIRRYLNNEPVLASPPSAAYLARKFVRRHRGGVAVSAAAAVVLLAFAVTTSVQNGVIARERDRAELESAKAAAVNDFLQDMLVSVDPWASGEHDLTVAEAMDNARADIDSIFAGQPEVAAEMHATMGQTYLGLQKLAAAEEEVRRGLEMRTALLGPDAPELADSWMALAKIQRLNMQPEEGIASAREVVRIRALHSAPTDMDMINAWDNLSELYITDRRFAEADSVLGLIADAVAASDLDLRAATAGMMMQQGRVAAEGRGDLAAADSLYVGSVDLLRAADPEAPVLSVYLNNAAVNQMVMQDFDRARVTFAEALELYERRFGADHPEYALTLENMGGIAFRLGQYDSCLANLERVKAIRSRKLGPDHPLVQRTMLNMATVASMSGNPERAIAIYDEIMPRMLEINGEMHIDTAATSRNLGIALAKAGRYEEARASYDRSRRIYAELLGEGHETVARLDHDKARLLIAQERWSAAEPYARRALEVFKATVGDDDPRRVAAEATLKEIADHNGR